MSMEVEESFPLPPDERGAGGWRRALRRRLPISAWLPEYSREAALADVVAGLTLGLTLVPQSIAYASLADLPIQVGLYSSFVGTILYMFLGTVKEVSIGPSSLMALLTLQACRGLPPQFAALLAFLSGAVVLIMGLLRLGFLVDLISPSVTSGFTTATAVVVMTSQVKGLLGLAFVAESISENAALIVQHWREIRLADCVLSAVCCTVLLLLRKLKDLKVHPKRRTLKKALFLICISRNALVVCLSSALAYLVHNPDKPLFKLSGRVASGMPSLSWPLASVRVGNQTLDTWDMAARLGPSLLLMPLVMLLANIAIAKAFSPGGRVDATQEMVTLGVCNMAGALFGAMPCCGAFTRSAVSHSSGVRSPAAGLYSGIIVILALAFMTEYFYFIPKACLSSVLICAVIFMVDIATIRTLYRHNRRELCVLLVTCGASVALSVEAGVLAGGLASLAALLAKVAGAGVRVRGVKTARGAAVVAAPGGALTYLCAERVAARVAGGRRAGAALMVDCGDVAFVDYSAKQTLDRLCKKMQEMDQKIIFFNASEKVASELKELNNLDSRALLARSASEALVAAGERDSNNDRTGGKSETEALLSNDTCDKV